MLQNFRKVIVYFLFLLTQFVVVSHLEAAPAQSINADKVHSIIVIADKGNKKALAKWSATAQYLSDYIQGHYFEIVPLQWDAMYEYVHSGKADFILSNPGMYVEFEVNHGIQRLVTLKNKRQNKPVDQFGSVIIKRSDRQDIKTIQDLKNKRLMMSHHKAWGGWQLGWMEMLKQGFDPKRDLAELIESGSHDKTVKAVLAGEVDAGVCRTDTLERLAAKGEIVLSDISLISSKNNYYPNFPFLLSTSLYPEWPFAVSKNVDEKLKIKITQTLLGMSSFSEAAVEGQYVGWTVPANYQPVHEVLRSLRITPYENFGEITLIEIIHNYWHILAISLLIIFITFYFNFRFRLINDRLKKTRSDLENKNNNLIQEIEERKAIEYRLSRADTIINSINQAIVITNLEPKIVDVNPAYCEMFGYSREELIGQNPNILSSGRQSSQFYRDMWYEFLKNGEWVGEIWDRQKWGALLPVLLNLTVIKNEQGYPINYVGILTDIESFKKLEDKLQRLAYFDGLTGLPNRTLMQDRMQQDLNSAKRNKEKMAVLFLDLDKFKEVNDSLGHEQGDHLLEIIADRLQQDVRENDIVSRQGGDEFIILLKNPHNTDDVAIVAKNIIKSVASPVHLAGSEVFVGASIGISLYPDDAVDVVTLIKYADEAMYQAKSDGRGRYSYYSDIQHEK